MPLNKRRVLGIVLAVSIVLLVFIAGYTYAKYAVQVNGAGSVGVAKWSFNANAGEDEITDIKLRDTLKQASLVDGKIAPGTGGSFDIVLDGTGSEVDIEYDVFVVNEKNIPTNLKFAIDGGEFKYNSLSELAQAELQNGRIEYSGNQVVKHRIDWNWPYESNNDEADTMDGIAALDYTFGLCITGIQAQAMNS